MGRQRGGEERLGVGVHRARAQGVARRRLDDLAQVHHGDPVTDVRDGGEVVADEEIAHAERALQLLELGDDLGPHRHVERGDRLVQDDQTRVGHERPRDRDPLALPAAEFVRKQRSDVRRQPDQLEHRADALVDRGAREAGVDLERLGDDVADAHARAERAERVLEDDLHGPAVRHQVRALEARDVPPLEADRPGGGRLLEQDQLGGRRLAASGFADEAERLAGVHRDVDAVHGLHPRRRAPEQPPPRGEVLLERPDFKNG